MAFLAVNRNGEELIFNDLPTYDRVEDTWKVLGVRSELVYDDPHDYSAGTHEETVMMMITVSPYLKEQLKKLLVVRCH